MQQRTNQIPLFLEVNQHKQPFKMNINTLSRKIKRVESDKFNYIKQTN